MSELDQAVVVTVVYDGPPFAGKTTSVRALGRTFGREVITPEERDGRTQFYDWLDYTGGRFEGAPIKCQVISVPGQEELRHRRDHFLRSADAVVFVADTTATAWPESVARLERLRAQLDARAGAPVGLVFQANKRDAADAVPLTVLEAVAAKTRTAVVESIASEGNGVREAFVFAIRLALDRVRAEHDPFSRIGVGSDPGPALVKLLEELGVTPEVKAPLLPPPPAPAPPEVDDTWAEPEPPRSSAAAIPRAPWQDVLSGFVWPPVDGRVLLREAAPLSGERVQITATGDLYVGLGSGWRVHSSASAEFADLESGRRALVAWARAHAAAQEALSRRRCIVLADTGIGRWRLWQIVEYLPSLRELIDADELPREVADRHLQALPATGIRYDLDTVGLEDDRPVFVGLMAAA